jgi:hypothetical protein
MLLSSSFVISNVRIGVIWSTIRTAALFFSPVMDFLFFDGNSGHRVNIIGNEISILNNDNHLLIFTFLGKQINTILNSLFPLMRYVGLPAKIELEIRPFSPGRK